MVNCQINKVTTKKVLESYIGEIFQTLKNHEDVCKVLQTKFLDQRHQIRSFVQSLNLFY